MNGIRSRLMRMENRLQSLIEGNLARLFSSSKASSDLGLRVLEALIAGIQTGPNGSRIAPNLFTLLVPTDGSISSEDQNLLEVLAREIEQAGEEAGLHFYLAPVVRISARPDVAPGEIRIETKISPEQIADTSTMLTEIEEKTSNIPANAFLIMAGSRTYPLDRAVLNIGRRIDNHLVIDDGRVSRVHAQLRAVKGRYVIFDLDSKGGTFVNGERIRQCTLYQGDVISLAGVDLIFGQDAHYPSNQGGTHRLTPFSQED